MSADGDRFILIDDNDPRIRYSGPWAPVETDAGLLNTMHQLIEPYGVTGLSVDFTGWWIVGISHSKFDFKHFYLGIWVYAWASTQHGNDAEGTLIPHPALYTVNCILDGRSVSNTSVTEASLEAAVCNSTQFLAAGTTHTLQIIFDFPSPSPDFRFSLDYIQVSPVQTQTIGAQENGLFYVGDPVIQGTIEQANAGWIRQGDSFATSVQGSQFTLQFTGPPILF